MHTYIVIHIYVIEGSLEVKLPTIWTDEKQRWEESEKRREEKKKEDQKEKRREEEIRSKRESLRRQKEDPGARKGGVFPMICGSGGSKSRLAKAAGAEPAGQMRYEQLHAVVARSTIQSQKCQKLTGSEHFWKLRCRKSARRCGAKQNDGRRGTYAEDMARCISRGRRSTRYMLIRAVRRSGR